MASDTELHVNAVLGRLLAGHVVEGELIDVERNGLQFRRMPFAVETVAIKQPAHEHVGVPVWRVHV